MRKVFCIIFSLFIIIGIFAVSAETSAVVWLDGIPNNINYPQDYYYFEEHADNVFGTVYSFESKKSGNNQMIDFSTGYKVGSGEGEGYIYLSFYYRSYGSFKNYLGNTVTGSSCLLYPQFRYAGIPQDVYTGGSKAFRTDSSGTWVKKSVIMKVNPATQNNASVSLRFKIMLLENFKIDIADPVIIYFGNYASDAEAAEIIDTYIKDNGYYYNKVSQSDEPYSAYGIELTGNYLDNKKVLWQSGKTSEGVVAEHTLRTWLNEMLPQIRVNNILSGNYAFVEGSRNYWNGSAVSVMNEPVIRDDNGKYMLPGDTAFALFGVGDGNSYIDIDSITGKNIFKDERGFVLLSDNPTKNYVDTEVGEEGGYRSAFDIADCIGTITWNDISPSDDDYEAFMSSWLEMLTYPKNSESKFSGFISETISQANDYLALYDENNELSPFTDIIIPDIEANQNHYLALENVYTRLRAMAIGYKVAIMTGNSAADTDKIKKAVLDGTELMYEKYYTDNAYRADGTPRFTTFKFKLPEALSDILLCMYDELDEDTIKKYVYEAIGRTVLPTVTQGERSYTDYTNRLWATVPFIKMAVLVKDDIRINHGYRYLSQIFDDAFRNTENPISPNGFFEDGSFVFHNSYAYNLGYGKSYLASVAEFSLLTKGTVFDVSKVHGYSRMYDRIINAYLPFIFDFKNMKLVAGRENAYSNARTTVASCILISENAPPEKKDEIAAHIKACIENGTNGESFLKKKTRFDTFTFLAYPTITEKMTEYLEYLKGIESSATENYNKIYYNMDRAVHKTDRFTFALAMSSSRISKYESSSTKPNSLTEWYTGDGMTYIHNDNKQYMSSWFEKANPYFMPGTTVDSTERSTEQTFNLSDDEWGLPENDFAGGVSNGKIGAAVMELGNKWVSGLKARKSYFMFDEEVVCMGSGITGGYGNVYTVADNRMLFETSNAAVDGMPSVGYEDIYINGNKEQLAFNEAHSYENPSSVWLEGNMGYVFLGENSVRTERSEYKKGSPFFMLTVQHGENPASGKYAYTLLPGADLKETLEYADNPKIEIIAQSDSVHAVKRLSDGTVAANVFEPCTLMGIEFKTPCSVLISGGKIVAADPTMKLDEIKLNYDTEITIDVSRTKGASQSYDINSFLVYNGKLEKVGDKLIGNVLADNNTDSNVGINVILAVYRDGKLVCTKVKHYVVKENSLINRLDISSDYIGREYSAKMFIWEDGMLPEISAVPYN